MPYTMEKKVQPVIIRLYCNCGKEMLCSPTTLFTDPPKYEYCCPSCGEIYTDTICYPIIEYREVK